MFITDPDYNYCIIEQLFASFTLRKQLDFRADRWAEALFERIEHFRAARRRKFKAEYKRTLVKRESKKQDFISIKIKNNIPLHHKLVKPNFIDGPIPEFSFAVVNLKGKK